MSYNVTNRDGANVDESFNICFLKFWMKMLKKCKLFVKNVDENFQIIYVFL